MSQSGQEMIPNAAADSAKAPSTRNPFWRRALPWVIALLAFLVADKLTQVFVPPQYRGIPDIRTYQDLYYSQKFERFDKVKDRLQLALLGDSRTRHGVDPAQFAENGVRSLRSSGYLTPSLNGPDPVTAFNFAAASSGIEFANTMVREYLVGLPQLRTVVWGVSPRIFNTYWEDPVYPLFTASRGYRHDLDVRESGASIGGAGPATHVAFDDTMSAVSATYAHRAILKSRVLDVVSPAGDPRRHFVVEPPMPMNEWGFFEFPPAKCVNMSDPERVAKYLDDLREGRFSLAAGRMVQFRGIIETLAERDIKLVCFVPPMHGSLTRSPSADADATPDKDYEALVAQLKTLESRYPTFAFLDIHNGGAHGFSDEEFGDFDHLNRQGATHLSRLLDEKMSTINWKARSAAASAEVKPAPRPMQTAPEVPQPASAAQALLPTVPSTADDKTPPKIRWNRTDDYWITSFPDDKPDLWAEYSDEVSGVDVASVRFFIDEKDVTDQCKVTANRLEFRAEEPFEAPKVYKFKVIVADKAGNKGQLEWVIRLKKC
jgi:hypothetical protein